MKYYIIIDNNPDAVEVSEEIYNLYVSDTDLVIWDEEKQEVVPNPNYEEVKALKRQAEFEKEFFKTSLGYVRRKAHMKDGTSKDFITDLIPLMEDTPNVPVLVYAQPDFTKEITEEVLIGLQSQQISTPLFISECKNQAIIDFYGYNPMQLLQSQQTNQELEEVLEEAENGGKEE